MFCLNDVKIITKNIILDENGLPIFDSYAGIFAFGMQNSVASSASSRPAQTNLHPPFNVLTNLFSISLSEAYIKQEMRKAYTKAIIF